MIIFNLAIIVAAFNSHESHGNYYSLLFDSLVTSDYPGQRRQWNNMDYVYNNTP